MSRANLLFGLALATMLAGGCSSDPSSGYTMKSPYRENVRTVAVPIWTVGRDVYRRDQEFRLTEAIQKRIVQNTPYKITSRAKADTILEGHIVEIRQQVTSYDPNRGTPRELLVRFTVSFAWRDLRTGAELVRRDNMMVTGNYIPHSPFDEDFYQGSAGVMDQMARQIVEQMESEWGQD